VIFSPESVPWRGRDAVAVFLLAWLGVPFVTVIALGQLDTVWPKAGDWLESLSRGDITASFWLLLASAAAAISLVAYYLKRYQVGWRDLGLKKFDVGRAILYIVGGIVASMAVVAAAFVAVQWLFPAFNPDQEQVNEFTKASTPGAVRLSFVALVVFPAFLEELVFRGFMFPAFAKRLGVVGGAVGSSLLFGVAHWQANIVVYTVVLGLILCFLYRKLGSIWPGVALHMINNWLAFAAIMSK
jgi:membrane protease YdiL (CAAX protease family)